MAMTTRRTASLSERSVDHVHGHVRAAAAGIKKEAARKAQIKLSRFVASVASTSGAHSREVARAHAEEVRALKASLTDGDSEYAGRWVNEPTPRSEPGDEARTGAMTGAPLTRVTQASLSPSRAAAALVASSNAGNAGAGRGGSIIVGASPTKLAALELNSSLDVAGSTLAGGRSRHGRARHSKPSLRRNGPTGTGAKVYVPSRDVLRDRAQIAALVHRERRRFRTEFNNQYITWLELCERHRAVLRGDHPVLAKATRALLRLKAVLVAAGAPSAAAAYDRAILSVQSELAAAALAVVEQKSETLAVMRQAFHAVVPVLDSAMDVMRATPSAVGAYITHVELALALEDTLASCRNALDPVIARVYSRIKQDNPIEPLPINDEVDTIVTLKAAAAEAQILSEELHARRARRARRDAAVIAECAARPPPPPPPEKTAWSKQMTEEYGPLMDRVLEETRARAEAEHAAAAAAAAARAGRRGGGRRKKRRGRGTGKRRGGSGEPTLSKPLDAEAALAALDADAGSSPKATHVEKRERRRNKARNARAARVAAGEAARATDSPGPEAGGAASAAQDSNNGKEAGAVAVEPESHDAGSASESAVGNVGGSADDRGKGAADERPRAGVASFRAGASEAAEAQAAASDGGRRKGRSTKVTTKRGSHSPGRSGSRGVTASVKKGRGRRRGKGTANANASAADGDGQPAVDAEAPAEHSDEGSRPSP